MPVTIAVVRETAPNERRLALTPEVAKKLAKLGGQIVMQSGAGEPTAMPDAQFPEAEKVPDARSALARADVFFKVQPPTLDEIAALRDGAIVISYLQPHLSPERTKALRDRRITSFAMELLPRTTRAQAMDVLSSQATLAGYRAVLLAATRLPRLLPMLVTAAGTVAAARAFVIGAGVAGLQAIATAKRLGAVIEAFDVRPAVKEQVESLGAKFVEVPLSEEEKRAAETSGGYAREMSDDYKQRQAALIAERAKAADIIITTALIPGRPAPVLVTEETLKGMRPGSVVVDLAVKQGGNCALSEADAVIVRHGVKIAAPSSLPSTLAADSSALYARNVLHFLNLLVDPKTGELKVDRSDEIIAATLVCADGAVVRS